MTTIYSPEINELDSISRELSFIDINGDHDIYTSITEQQLIILKENIELLCKELRNVNIKP